MNNVKIEYNQMKYLFDSLLSLKAKGVMAMMVAYINKNNSELTFSLSDVMPLCCDGKSAFSNAISELETLGYLERGRCRNFAGGTSPWEYTLKE